MAFPLISILREERPNAVRIDGLVHPSSGTAGFLYALSADGRTPYHSTLCFAKPLAPRQSHRNALLSAARFHKFLASCAYKNPHQRRRLSVTNTAAVEARATGSNPFFRKASSKAAVIPASADHKLAVE